MRKAGTEAGRDKAWLANANFNLGFALGVAARKVRLAKTRVEAKPG